MTQQADIAELKNRLSEFLEAVEKGDEVIVCKRNIPFARITAMPPRPRKNTSKPGREKGKMKINGDITGPSIPEKDWNMLREDFGAELE